MVLITYASTVQTWVLWDRGLFPFFSANIHLLSSKWWYERARTTEYFWWIIEGNFLKLKMEYLWKCLKWTTMICHLILDIVLESTDLISAKDVSVCLHSVGSLYLQMMIFKYLVDHWCFVMRSHFALIHARHLIHFWSLTAWEIQSNHFIHALAGTFA